MYIPSVPSPHGLSICNKIGGGSCVCHRKSPPIYSQTHIYPPTHPSYGGVAVYPRGEGVSAGSSYAFHLPPPPYIRTHIYPKIHPLIGRLNMYRQEDVRACRGIIASVPFDSVRPRILIHIYPVIDVPLTGSTQMQTGPCTPVGSSHYLQTVHGPHRSMPPRPVKDIPFSRIDLYTVRPYTVRPVRRSSADAGFPYLAVGTSSARRCIYFIH